MSEKRDKLELVAETELKDIPVQKRVIITDFAGNANTKFYDEFMKKVNDIDIGLVVLAAGQYDGGFFDS